MTRVIHRAWTGSRHHDPALIGPLSGGVNGCKQVKVSSGSGPAVWDAVVASRRCSFGYRQGEWVKSELWGRRAAGDLPLWLAKPIHE